MKKKRHSILSRITACSFIVLIIGAYFNFLYSIFGGEAPAFVSYLYALGLGSSIFLAILWLFSLLMVFFRGFFK